MAHNSIARNSTVLVTGATGTVGGQVTRRLVDAGIAVRALTRDPGNATLPDGVTAVAGDLSDADSLDAALDGVDQVFLVFPTMQADHAAPEVVEKIAQKAARIVYLSAAGVSDQETEGILGSHANLERLIEKSGLAWTFLRPSGFASNTLAWADQIRAGGPLRWFHGAASRSLIHEADIAAVAVRVLTDDGHDGARYHLTGPARLTQVEQAAAIGEAIGRPVPFEELSPDEVQREVFAGLPAEFVKVVLDAHAAMVTNPEPVTDTVAEVTGAPALPFRQWAVDNAHRFR